MSMIYAYGKYAKLLIRLESGDLLCLAGLPALGDQVPDGKEQWMGKEVCCMPKVSVIMPVCDDNENFLKEALSSITGQTWRDLELIVVDGSQQAQKTRHLVENQKDDRIRYFYRKKNGLADALNYALELSKGDYIARMDADDVSAPDRLEKQISFLEMNPEVGVVSTSFDVIDGEGNILGQKCLGMGHEEVKTNLIFENPVCHPSVMFRRRVLDNGWRYGNAFSEDYELWIRMIPYEQFAVMSDRLLYYRQYGGNISSRMLEKVESSSINSLKEYLAKNLTLDVGTYDNDQFLKNYQFGALKTIGYEERFRYLEIQIQLLRDIVQKNSETFFFERVLLEDALKTRWKKLLKLFDVECKWNSEDLAAIKENRERFMKMQNQQVRFFFYGAGNEAGRVIRRYEELLEKKQLSWQIQGVIDRADKIVQIGGVPYKTQRIHDLAGAEYDFIIITSERYYDAIRKELLDIGVEHGRIMKDACFGYF